MVISYALAWDKPSRGKNRSEQLDLIVVGTLDCQPLRLRGLVWSDEMEHVVYIPFFCHIHNLQGINYQRKSMVHALC